jgi:hypothetical protein
MHTFCQSITAPKMAIGYETSRLLNLTTYKKFGVMVFNKLPSYIKIFTCDVKHFKSALENYIYLN